MKPIVTISAIAIASFFALEVGAQHTSERLTHGWEFARGGAVSAAQWQPVVISHDWAIYGPFDRNNDLRRTVSDSADAPVQRSPHHHSAKPRPSGRHHAASQGQGRSDSHPYHSLPLRMTFTPSLIQSFADLWSICCNFLFGAANNSRIVCKFAE